MKKIILFLTLVITTSIAIISCKDDFNEEEFLKLQSKLKLEQDSIARARNKAAIDSTDKAAVQSYINAQAAAGKLLSFTVTIRDNDNPVSGVTVSLTGGAASGSGTTNTSPVTVTTDANGNAVFDNASFGKSAIAISKSGFISASAFVDFGAPPAPQAIQIPYQVGSSVSTVTYYTAPAKQFQTAILPIFSSTGGTTATIKGKVTIETDLSNTTPEIPQGLTVSADFSSMSFTTVSTTAITGYKFADGTYGTAPVDNTTGAYSIVVPASVSGFPVRLIFPTIETSQRLAITNVDGKPLSTGPEYRNVTTQFGSTIPVSTSIPVVPGAKVTFSPSPVNPGAGVQFNFTAVPRKLEASQALWKREYYDNIEFPFQVGATQYQVTNHGSGYVASPTVTVSGGGATSNATMRTSVGGVLTGLNLTAGGTGYVGNAVSVQIRFKDANDNDVNMNNFLAPITTSGGVISTITLPSNSSGIYGLDPANPFHPRDFGTANFGIKSFDVVIFGGGGTGATATGTFNCFIDGIQLTNGGSGYTSAPTITFSAPPSGGTNATMSVLEFRSKWTISIDNSGNSVPYSILPDNIYFSAMHTNGNFWTDTGIEDQFNNLNNLRSVLTVSNGQIAWINPSYSYRTNDYSLQPTIVIEDYTPKPASAKVIVNNDGTIQGLSNTQLGRGYNSQVSMTVSPSATEAPGSGALMALTNGQLHPHTKEFEFWPGNYSIKNAGSGYVTDLNQQNNAPVNAGWQSANSLPTIIVKSGQIFVQDYYYGTGKRTVNVD